jgi:hypothetical protein
MKDIFVVITSENMKHLHELPRFISSWEYPKQERELHIHDLGKIETKTCCFRFIKHVNVKVENHPKEKRFFLSKPEESELIDSTLEDFEVQMTKLIPVKKGSVNATSNRKKPSNKASKK